MWKIAAVVGALLSVPLIIHARYERLGTQLEGYYLRQYVRAALWPMKKRRYRVIEVGQAKGKWTLATDADLGGPPDGLSGDAKGRGMVRLREAEREYNRKEFQSYLQEAVYGGKGFLDLLGFGLTGGACLLVPALVFAYRKDQERQRIRRDGRRVRGPEPVTPEVFNRRHGSAGIIIIGQEELGLIQKRPRRVVIPGDLESSHFLICGDTGTGKSTLLRQLLVQIALRGEIAIVYDPALEYTPLFYEPERGDVLLNPMDARTPYWSPGDEVADDADATTMAMSLFPERPGDHLFFAETSRQLFARLLMFRPTAEDLLYWLCHREEIDRRVHETELDTFIDPISPNQRSGVLASVSLIANALRRLPKADEGRARWSAVDWSKKRSGWIFLGSTPRTRGALLPLTSLWLDMLVLRVMSDGIMSSGGPPVWFVLDELASLQKLPQLHTAVTEGRKSNVRMVLGFQGRSQIDKRYGEDAEAMLSQPATKIFLGTSEPRAAEWISKCIGDVEIERIRESRTDGRFPNERHTTSDMVDRHTQPLVMASEVAGLGRLRGYLKCGNLVAELSVKRYELPEIQPKFIPRVKEPGADGVVLALPLPEPPGPAPAAVQATVLDVSPPGPAATDDTEDPVRIEEWERGLIEDAARRAESKKKPVPAVPSPPRPRLPFPCPPALARAKKDKEKGRGKAEEKDKEDKDEDDRDRSGGGGGRGPFFE